MSPNDPIDYRVRAGELLAATNKAVREATHTDPHPDADIQAENAARFRYGYLRRARDATSSLMAREILLELQVAEARSRHAGIDLLPLILLE